MKEMIKKYRGSLICSVLVMLIGVLVGFTSTQSMWVNVFFVVTDCALVAIIFYDNRNRQQSRKIIGMTMWIIPIITLLYNGIARLVNMGADMENLFMAVIYYKARGERDYHGSANFHDSRGYKESLFFSR